MRLAGQQPAGGHYAGALRLGCQQGVVGPSEQAVDRVGGTPFGHADRCGHRRLGRPKLRIGQQPLRDLMGIGLVRLVVAVVVIDQLEAVEIDEADPRPAEVVRGRGSVATGICRRGASVVCAASAGRSCCAIGESSSSAAAGGPQLLTRVEKQILGCPDVSSSIVSLLGAPATASLTSSSSRASSPSSVRLTSSSFRGARHSGAPGPAARSPHGGTPP
jgi:hypothetical protein